MSGKLVPQTPAEGVSPVAAAVCRALTIVGVSGMEFIAKDERSAVRAASLSASATGAEGARAAGSPHDTRLSRNAVLSRSMPSDAALVMGCAERVRLHRGDTLTDIGDMVDRLCFPETAVLALVVPMRDGTSAEVAFVGREGMVGGMALLGVAASAVRATVLVAGDALRVPVPAIRRLCDASRTLHASLLGAEALLHAAVVRSAACHALHPARARLARFLLEFQDRTGKETLLLTQDETAAMLGVQRTTVTAAAQTLMERGLITYRRGQIGILDRPGLEAMACECYHCAPSRLLLHG